LYILAATSVVWQVWKVTLFIFEIAGWLITAIRL